MGSSTTGRRKAATALASIGVLALVGCHGKSSDDDGGSGSASKPPSSAAQAKRAVSVEVKDFQFTPATATVLKGGKVTWTFDDDADHNVDIDKLKKKSPDLQGGKKYTLTFSSPGTYSYICTIHQYMTAKVIVK